MFSEILTIEEKDRGSGAMRETIILLRNPVWWESPALPGGELSDETRGEGRLDG